MDVWVVAAAAGAGYVVQQLKNLSSGKNKWLDPTPLNLNNGRPQSSCIRHKVEDKSCPSCSWLSRKKFAEEMSNGERDKVCEASFDFETYSSRYEDENLLMRDDFKGYGTAFDSSSLAPALDKEDVQGGWEGGLLSDSREDFTSDMLPLPSSSEIGFSNNSKGKGRSLKSRRFNSQLIKPQTSHGSCCMAQLYKERDEIEEYARHPLGKPILKPFLVTDGSKIISTVPCESFSIPIGTGTEKGQPQKHGCSRVNETVCGVPRLPNIVPVEAGKKAKIRDKMKHTTESKGGYGDHGNAQGTSDRALIFYLGLTMGAVSSFLANKEEAEKMKSLLKQSESLVQDLQEELEMKDLLTVKELAAEDCEIQDVHSDCFVDGAVHSSSLEEKFDEEYCSEKADEKSLNEIEAELEAELQRLESSMNSSSLEGRLGNLIGLEPDSTPVFHEGKLRSDSFAADQLHADRDGSRSPTPPSCYYAVSPRELSLRLHQVIQSRLEDRVKELETALQNSQRKVEYMESELVHPWRELSNSIKRTSSTHDSPVAKDVHESIDQPVIINLSGEALAAYNEAFEEFTKASESDDEELQAGFEDGNDVENGCTDRHSGSRKALFDQLTEEDVESPVKDGDEEEMERLLIRQIVEKAKQGSPAVLKAQKAFLSTNFETEQ